MDRAKAVLLAFLITSNLLIFFYGIAKSASAGAYEKETIAALNLDSAMVSAIHACEDMKDLEEEYSFKLNGCETAYAMSFSDTGGFYIRARTSVAGITHTREAVYYR